MAVLDSRVNEYGMSVNGLTFIFLWTFSLPCIPPVWLPSNVAKRVGIRKMPMNRATT